MSGKVCSFTVMILLLMAVTLSGCCGMGCGTLPRIGWSFPGMRTRTLRGSGNLVTREMDFRGFTKLDVTHAFKVYLTQSDSYQVVITADDNLFDVIEVSKSGDTLRIGVQSGDYSLQNITLRAEVSLPTLEGVDLSGASSLTGETNTGDVQFELSGASRLTLDGTAGDLRLEASGASDVDLSGFVVDSANLEVSGASEATVNVTGRLDVKASGASHVYYLGNPTLGRIDTSGASSVAPGHRE